MTGIDLCCGAGGLSRGLIDAGLDIVLGVDHWADALQVYTQNLGVPTLQADLERLPTLPRVDLIAAGTPCQDWSGAGKREEGANARVTTLFGAIVGKNKPPYFLYENVTQAINSPIYHAAKTHLKSGGYGLTEVILDASLYGVPQKRKRLVLVGVLGGEDNALRDLLVAGASDQPLTVWAYCLSQGMPLAVEFYYHNSRNGNSRAIWGTNEPAPTLRSSSGLPLPSGYRPHPGDASPELSQVRALTLKEASLIQTFPVLWDWCDLKLLDCWGMVANAVPPKLGLHLGRVLLKAEAMFRTGQSGVQHSHEASGANSTPHPGTVPVSSVPPDVPQRTRLIHGTCPLAVYGLYEETFDLVLSDGPYPGIKRPYGCYTEVEWMEMMQETTVACWDLLKPTGSMVFIIQPNCSKAGQMRTWHLEFTLWAAKEFGLVQDVYWFNTSPIPCGPVCSGFLRPAIKWCVWLGKHWCYHDQSKVLKERYNPGRTRRGDSGKISPSGRTRRTVQMDQTSAERGGSTPFNVREISTASGSPGSESHPAVTTLEVADWWCRYLLPPRGVLLDCFVGSGTMLEAGLRNGASKVIGIDRNKEYLGICRRRLGLAEAA